MQVSRMVLGDALTLGAVGVILEVAAALAGSRLVERLLFGVGAHDLSTVAGTALAVFAVVVI